MNGKETKKKSDRIAASNASACLSGGELVRLNRVVEKTRTRGKMEALHGCDRLLLLEPSTRRDGWMAVEMLRMVMQVWMSNCAFCCNHHVGNIPHR